LARKRRKRPLARRRKTCKKFAWSRHDRDLTPRQRLQKAEFLHSLSSARRGKRSLEEALSRQGINPEQISKNTDAVKMVKGILVPKVRDRIPRSMRFYEKGKLVHAEIANSEVASDIGHYWNAIRELVETGKSKTLRSLPRQRFKALDGCFHALEKNPKIILELEARKPKFETFEIYTR